MVTVRMGGGWGWGLARRAEDSAALGGSREPGAGSGGVLELLETAASTPAGCQHTSRLPAHQQAAGLLMRSSGEGEPSAADLLRVCGGGGGTNTGVVRSDQLAAAQQWIWQPPGATAPSRAEPGWRWRCRGAQLPAGGKLQGCSSGPNSS